MPQVHTKYTAPASCATEHTKCRATDSSAIRQAPAVLFNGRKYIRLQHRPLECMHTFVDLGGAARVAAVALASGGGRLGLR